MTFPPSTFEEFYYGDSLMKKSIRFLSLPAATVLSFSTTAALPAAFFHVATLDPVNAASRPTAIVSAHTD